MDWTGLDYLPDHHLTQHILVLFEVSINYMPWNRGGKEKGRDMLE